MSEPLRRIVDGAVGETRLGLFQGERALALDALRWSEIGKRARWGEIYGARVLRVDARRGGAFVDLGLGEGAGGFLPAARAPVREGEALSVRVTREAAGAKAAVVARVPDLPVGKVGRIAAPPEDLELAAAPPASAEDRALLDEAFEDALARRVTLRGGGALTIDACEALTAVDVDAADRDGPADPARFIRELNLAAAEETLRQLRLRNIGGLVVIDFVSMRLAEDRRAVELAVKAAAKADPWGVQTAPMSRFGLVELARGRLRRAHAEAMLARGGGLTDETLALEGLRRIESVAREARGRRVVLEAPARVARWLEGAHISWRAGLEARIGTFWRIESVAQDFVRARTE